MVISEGLGPRKCILQGLTANSPIPYTEAVFSGKSVLRVVLSNLSPPVSLARSASSTWKMQELRPQEVMMQGPARWSWQLQPALVFWHRFHDSFHLTSFHVWPVHELEKEPLFLDFLLSGNLQTNVQKDLPLPGLEPAPRKFLCEALTYKKSRKSQLGL